MTVLKDINQIELHYFFDDDSHSLEAFTRNKCEAEFLYIIKEVLQIFELDFEIETFVPTEGGLKEVWKFIGKNNKEITAISAVITAITAIVALILNTQPTDPELINLQKEDLKLSIEQKKLDLKKSDDSKVFKKEEIKETAKLFDTNIKIIKHRSNFYEYISGIEKITKITTSTLYENQYVEELAEIEKKDFYKFIVYKNDLPLEVIENAEIEIISPILKQGKFKWKGIYNNEQIDFQMKDNDFKKSIFNGEVSFSSGFNIKCVLEVKNIIDEMGNLRVKNYSVITVLSKLTYDNNKVIEQQTLQGKKYLNKKKEQSQPNLLDLMSKN